MSATSTNVITKRVVGNWIVRLLKGLVVGIGAIVPGLSGGVLAIVLGLYQPLMYFLTHFRVNFIKNVLFFLPVGIGVLLGGFLFAAVVDLAFSNYSVQIIWLFIGFITGTLPALFREAAEKGRKRRHWLIVVAIAALMFIFMRWLAATSNVSLPPTFLNWILSGILVGLGVVLPGMSPSNFLIYVGLYQPMASGISHLDFNVIIPLSIGLVACVLLFARFVTALFRKAYTTMYHTILGVVVGSTIAIVPFGIRGWTLVISLILFALGVAISMWFSRLEEKYPHDPTA